MLTRNSCNACTSNIAIDKMIFTTYRLVAKIKEAKLKAQDPSLGDSCFFFKYSCANSPCKMHLSLHPRCVKIMAKEHIYKVLKADIDKQQKNLAGSKRKHGDGDEAATPAAEIEEGGEPEAPPKKMKGRQGKKSPKKK